MQQTTLLASGCAVVSCCTLTQVTFVSKLSVVCPLVMAGDKLVEFRLDLQVFSR